jgi:DNA modification methylase
VKQLSLTGAGWRNQLYCGDCLTVLDNIPDKSVDLVYIDPPFYSQRVYETIWGEEAERFAFEDRWSGGINHYVNYLIDRVKKMYAKLKDTGSFYIHLDWHISHYMKVELDKLFDYNNFRNEIVWKRTSGHSDADRCGNVHDVLLFYSKSDSYTWNKVFQAYDQEYTQQYYRYREKGGRRFMSADLTGAGSGPPRKFGNRGSIPPPKGRHWMYDQSGIDRLLVENRIFWTRNGVPRLKTYLDEASGMPLQDVWTDVQALRSWHDERIGYPTQKPVALLERIISVSSNEGDLVMDAYCGCGTTMEAAQKLRRRWIGIDISQSAIRVVEQRLQKAGAANYDVHGLVKSQKELKALTPFEFQNWAINAVYGQHSPKKVADMGIDGFTFMDRHPIQVKQTDHVGRPVVDAFIGVLEREKEKKGLIIAFGFTGGAVEEVARLERESKIKIELVKCADLIAGTVPYKIMV